MNSDCGELLGGGGFTGDARKSTRKSLWCRFTESAVDLQGEGSVKLQNHSKYSFGGSSGYCRITASDFLRILVLIYGVESVFTESSFRFTNRSCRFTELNVGLRRVVLIY